MCCTINARAWHLLSHKNVTTSLQCLLTARRPHSATGPQKSRVSGYQARNAFRVKRIALARRLLQSTRAEPFEAVTQLPVNPEGPLFLLKLAINTLLTCQRLCAGERQAAEQQSKGRKAVHWYACAITCSGKQHALVPALRTIRMMQTACKWSAVSLNECCENNVHQMLSVSGRWGRL